MPDAEHYSEEELAVPLILLDEEFGSFEIDDMIPAEHSGE
jgi:hypothetical protein